MPVFLSPGVFTREIDLSVLPSGTGALRPAFIGTAKKGPLNVPTLVTTAAQYVETFGEPFPESYLGYAVIAYLEEGNSCYILRVGVEYQTGLPADLAAIAVDTSGANIHGWGRIPVFTGIDYGLIRFRPVTASDPVTIHNANATAGAWNDADVSGSGLTASITFTDTSYNGCYDEIYTLSITGEPTGSGPIDGATYIITDSSGDEIQTGTLTTGTGGDSQSEDIKIVGSDVIFYITVAAGALDVNDSVTISAQPDNRSLVVVVEGGAAETLSIATGTYSTAAAVAAAIENQLPNAFDGVVVANSANVDVPAIRTNTAGNWIQLTGDCALCAELGVAQYSYDIPRSYLYGSDTGILPTGGTFGLYNLTSSNNRIVLDVIGQSDTVRFDFSIPTATNTNATSIASQIDPNGTSGGSTYFDAFTLTTPDGLPHLFIVTSMDHKYDQLKMQATFSYLATLRFAEEMGIDYPYTLSYRTFDDARVTPPSSNPLSLSQPLSCSVDPASDQCALDSTYFQNIIGYIVAKSPGTWVDDYTVSLASCVEGVGDTAGRFKLTVKDAHSQAVDVVDDITFDPDDTRYIGNVVNAGSTLGGINGNAYYQWENRPDYLGTDVRTPSQFADQAFSGGADGIPTNPTDSAELDKAVIGNPALSTGIYALQNPEAFDFNLLLIPGFTTGPIIAQAVQFCENRGDVLYLVDPPLGLRPQQVIDWHNGMLTSDLVAAINTSYGALYWSWIKANDQFNGGTIWIPPSGHVGAVFARTERDAEPWFAPAGLNRGRILSALELEYNPTQGERNALYGSGNAVNPIVNFTQQGIVIWGQRTLQRQATALDRVNVRMLLIYLKKNLQIALRSFVFDQNDVTTRARVKGTLNPFMADVMARRGMTAYVVVCDETNNTPERIDRNELWVSVFIKPTRAVEFIVLNLAVLRTGASFGAQEILATGGVVTA